MNPTWWSRRARSLLALKHRYTDVLKACVNIILQSKNRDEIAQATALKKKLESFKFVVSLVMMSHVLNIVDMPSKLLQDKEMDISKAIHVLSQAKLQLCNYRNNFPALMKEAADICKRWSVAACFSQKRTHESCLFQGPEDRFRICVYFAVIDITTSQISNFFESFSLVVKKFDLLDPHKLSAMSKKELESACQNLIQIYSELQPSLYFEMF